MPKLQERDGVGQRGFRVAEPSAFYCRLDTRGDDEGQRAFVHHVDERVLDAQRAQYVAHLLADVVAVVERDPGLQIDFNTAAGAIFDAYVHVGAHIASRAPRFAALQVGFSCHRESQK